MSRRENNVTGVVNGNYVSSLNSHDLISDEQRVIFQWLFYSILAELANIFGTATNIINIICFSKQGFKDAVNISLLGLAVSDLGCLLTLIWTGICYNPAFLKLDLPFDPIEVQYVTAGGPHIIFTRVTSCITVFITMERCLCVTMPLKVKTLLSTKRVTAIIIFLFPQVKTLLSTKRVTVIIILLFAAVFATLMPGYYGSHLGLKFFPERNKSLLGTVFSDHRKIIEAVTFGIGGVFVELAAFALVLACTTILVVKLRGKSKWRLKSATPGQTSNLSSRDQKVNKMVIVISTLFITCFTPTCVTIIGMIMDPELSVTGGHRNLFVCAFSVCFTLESINSATNIFIYYHMSSKYRAVLRQMFLPQYP